MAAISIGNFAIFAGGYDGSNIISTIDIYDTSLTRITDSNIIKKFNIMTALCGQYAIFAGGEDFSSYQTSAVAYTLI